MLSVYAKIIKKHKKTAQVIFQNIKSVIKLSMRTIKGD